MVAKSIHLFKVKDEIRWKSFRQYGLSMTLDICWLPALLYNKLEKIGRMKTERMNHKWCYVTDLLRNTNLDVF